MTTSTLYILSDFFIFSKDFFEFASFYITTLLIVIALFLAFCQENLIFRLTKQFPDIFNLLGFTKYDKGRIFKGGEYIRSHIFHIFLS